MTRPGMSPRRPLKPFHAIATFAVVLSVLFASAFVAGARGVFSSAEQTLFAQLRDPAKRLDATAAFAEQFAISIGEDHPTLAGSRDSRDCPGPYETEATTIVGSFTQTELSKAMDAAAHRFSSAGWIVTAPRRSPASSPSSMSARTRRGVTVTVSPQLGADLSSLVVTVEVPCPSTTPKRSTP